MIDYISTTFKAENTVEFIQDDDKKMDWISNFESKDLNKTFEWSNDTLARNNSFNSNKIKFEEHKKWFLNKIYDSNNI